VYIRSFFQSGAGSAGSVRVFFRDRGRLKKCFVKHILVASNGLFEESLMVKIYSRAPITEAVIEVRTKAAIDVGQLDRLVARYSRRYPSPPQKLFDVSVEVGETSSKANHKLNGYRLYSADSSRVVILGMNSIGSAKIAPYEGWEKLLKEARENWEIWLKIVGWQTVARVGVRYINRIDIPTTSQIELEDYLTFQPALPKALDKGIRHFAMNVVIPLGKDDLSLVLNAGSVPSPVIGCQSLILDLDVSRESNLPNDDASLWGFIESMRDRKNDVFESCITDKTRALMT
jgi:uncharacterized protein (TIGR04255 family)